MAPANKVLKKGTKDWNDGKGRRSIALSCPCGAPSLRDRLRSAPTRENYESLASKKNAEDCWALFVVKNAELSARLPYLAGDGRQRMTALLSIKNHSGA